MAIPAQLKGRRLEPGNLAEGSKQAMNFDGAGFVPAAEAARAPIVEYNEALRAGCALAKGEAVA